MKRRTIQSEGKRARSPYVKYNKSPYAYSFKTCKHSNRVFQSVPATAQCDGWSGHVCAVCNIIVDNERPRFRAIAA